jgi:glycosyltransferase involved in cell wall biosynthesis
MATPPPMTGQSIAGKWLIDDLIKREQPFTLINFRKNNFKQGFSSSSERLKEILDIFLKILRERRSCSRVYYVISQSLAGNIRDLVFLWLLRNKNISVHLHGGGIYETVFKRSALLRVLNRYVLSKVDRVIVLGESLKTCFSDMGIDDSLVLIENGVDDIFLEAKNANTKYHDTRKLKWLFLSNMIPGKGHWEFLAAIEMLEEGARSKIEFTFVGDFENLIEKEKFMKKLLSLGSSVRYLGVLYGAEKLKVLEESHVFCLPTYYAYEGQPISILEAYASGCVVVTTKHNGIVDIFKPGLNGYQVEKESVTNLLEVIQEISSSDKELLLKISLYNQQVGRSQFSKKKYLDRLYGVIMNDSASST